jgi:hypothetical protein
VITGTEEIKVTADGKLVRAVPAEFIPVPFGRGSPIGTTGNGILYAAFATEGPGLESTLLSSTDGGRSWTEKRLDWWQFFNHTVGRDSLEFLFWDNRWAMRNQSFGVLKNGALLWAFEQDAADLEKECYVIRSEDGGETWEGPIKLDKSPFSSVGNCSNRMTELPDGTILWPQRLGCHVAEWEKRRNELENSGQLLTAADFSNSYVFRSADEGHTWGDRTPLPDWSFETTLLRLHSGRLIAAIRYQPLIELDTPLSKFGKRVFLADSEDNGRTWVNFRPVRRTPDGESDLALGECHGELSQLSNGTLVLTHDHRYPYEQQQVLARVSHDEGNTWTPEIYHLTHPGGSVLGSHQRGVGSGYASSVVLEDDTIVTMTGAGTCVRWKVE